ncbi:MAG: endonuclease Q family protein [Candidatus Uhrbacteria bacterium]
MRIIADLHIHSRFSRACSKEITLPNIAATCARKGIDLVVTGDFTHPAWRKEIGEELIENAPGIFECRTPQQTLRVAAGQAPNAERRTPETKFILGTELSCIYKHDGAVRRVHHVILAPSLTAVDRLIASFEHRDLNLRSDGRPILGLSSRELLSICLEADERMLLIPAHAWTPWFAIFGSESGYDSIAACFGDLASHITAIETGLSSDPKMNRRLSVLDSVALVSSSDAHSLDKLGREATVFDLDVLTFDAITAAIRASAPVRYDKRASGHIIETIEFFPEEGKYHYDGHRTCEVRFSPLETKRHRGICPQCAKPLTVGVMHRVDKLADRSDDFQHTNVPSFRSVVPLAEIIAEAFGVKSATKRVCELRERLTRDVGNELHVVIDAPLDMIARVAPIEVVEAIRRTRAGDLEVLPGYDGEYGTVRIFTDARPRPIARQSTLV